MSFQMQGPQATEWAKLARNILGLFLCLAVADFMWGFAMKSAERGIYSGDRVGIYNLASAAPQGGMLILGSSRAYDHYDTRILGRNSTNLGMYGHGVDIARIMFQLAPGPDRLVIIDPMFFENETERLAVAHHLYGKSPIIDSILTRDDPTLEFLLRSNFYRYAYVSTALLLRAASPAKLETADSSRHRLGLRQLVPGRLRVTGSKVFMPPDSWWVSLDDLIGEVKQKGCTPVIVISPCADDRLAPFFSRLKADTGAKCRIIDCSDMLERSDKFFADTIHLNIEGAREFSHNLSRILGD